MWAPAVAAERLFEILGPHGILPRIDDAVDFARKHQVLLLHHEPSGVPLDISLAWLPFEEEAIRSAEEWDFAGLRIHVPRPGDLLCYKLYGVRRGLALLSP